MSKCLCFLSLMFVLSFDVSGQKIEAPSQHQVYICKEQIAFQDFFGIKSEAFKLSKETEMIDVTKLGNKYADNHKKYKQVYKGIDVYGVSYFLHGKDGKVTHGSGTFLPEIQMDIIPNIDEKMADIKAVSGIRNLLMKPFIKSKTEKKDIALTALKAVNKGLVIIDNAFPSFSGVYSLAYKYEVYSDEKPLKYEVVISAKDGKMIFNQSLIQHAHGIGNTFYYGKQSIITDSLAPNKFVLRDLSRGKGITTYTNRTGGAIKELVDLDNVWDDPEAVDLVGIDAHYTTGKFYDMMVEYCGYSGLDGQGLSLNPVIYVDGDDNFVNAYWDGDKAYFGQGNCHYGPLVTHSVVSHEFTHGVTQYNSGLIYAGESGAINESLSDIFGKSAEYLFDNSRFSWDLGPEFSLDQFTENFRSMSDPNDYEHPKTYKGLFWEDGADVHVNSSVFNHWYYLLIEGKSGNAENGLPYAVSPVSVADALDIVFLCQTSYLTPSSGYPELYSYTLLACESLFGKQSAQYKSIQEAWKAVGLPANNSGGDTKDLSINSTVGYEVTCLTESFYTLTLNVKNEGNTTIAAGESFEISFQDESVVVIPVVLTENLEPGQTKVVTIDNEIYFEGSDIKFLTVSLNYQLDENFDNNDTYVFLNNFAGTGPDFEIYYFQAKTECFVKEKILTGSLMNASCFTIPKGTPFQLLIKEAGTVINTKNFTLDEDLLSAQYYLITYKLELDAGDYSIEIKSPVDNNIDNNESFVNLQGANGTISSPVKYTFSDASFNDVFTISQSNFLEINSYQNENYLTSFGYSFDEVPCLKPNSNFSKDPYSTNTNSARACIDLTNFTAPQLSFDLRQYRSSYLSQFGDDSLSAISSIMKLSYKNTNETIIDYIYGQEEGKKVAHKYSLPKGFKGELTLSFYNNDGNQFFSASQLSEVDAMLLDNLAIDNASGIEDTEDDTFFIYPNPAFDYFTINPGITATVSLSILSTDGQVVKQFNKAAGNTKINVSDLVAGYYILKVVDEKGKPSVVPFIKM